MKMKIQQDNASLFTNPDMRSKPICDLKQGDVVERIGVRQRNVLDEKWIEITLPNGTKGFLPHKTKTFDLITAHLNGKTPMYANADRSTIKAELSKGSVVDFLDRVDRDGERWFYVKDESGNHGYIDGLTTDAFGNDAYGKPKPKPAWVKLMLASAISFGLGVVFYFISPSNPFVFLAFIVCAIQFILGFLLSIIHVIGRLLASPDTGTNAEQNISRD